MTFYVSVFLFAPLAPQKRLRAHRLGCTLGARPLALPGRFVRRIGAREECGMRNTVGEAQGLDRAWAAAIYFFFLDG